ncbi:MAG: biotin transporter BioY [Anaerolineae bacterium]|nr:biotin transporter BioY [Anaerolineales bacterium]MCQ3974439.1 biotin transporter BioY [Anaerolineae bacterium]
MNASINTKTLPAHLSKTLWLWLAVTIIFAAITALTARITIPLPFTPVPITLQTLAVVLSGLVLGARGGALAQLFYLGLIAAGLPLDARGLGPAAFFSPTAGYLIGFVPAAFVAGWLAERLTARSWWGNFVAALAGMLVIYLLGAGWLAVMLGSWQKAWLGGVAPFILLDLGKAAIAAGVAESGKHLFRTSMLQ